MLNGPQRGLDWDYTWHARLSKRMLVVYGWILALGMAVGYVFPFHAIEFYLLKSIV
jgi:hypothetical protein